MLHPETPYPYPGSYALYECPERRRVELVRIMWRRAGDHDAGAWIAISFPLIDGASGNKVVAEGDLIDATPVSFEESREFHDLDRWLAGKALNTKKQKALAKRRDALKQRVIWAGFMATMLRQLRDQQQRKAA